MRLIRATTLALLTYENICVHTLDKLQNSIEKETEKKNKLIKAMVEFNVKHDN